MNIDFSAILEFIKNYWNHILGLLGLIGTFLTVRSYRKEKKAKKALIDNNIAVYNMDQIRENPNLIMGYNGREDYGFKRNVYIQREIDETIKNSIESNPITIITGQAGIGKSRTIYEYLVWTDKFNKVVVLKNSTLTCTLEELQQMLIPYIDSGTLIYIDNFQHITYKEGNPDNLIWNKWNIIVNKIKELSGTIVFVSRSGLYFENDNTVKCIEMPLIDRNSNEYKECQERFSSVRYSSIVGSYVEELNIKRREDVIKNEGELILYSTYKFITHYFHRKGKKKDFLQQVYSTICTQIEIDTNKEKGDNLKGKFEEAYKGLQTIGILDNNNELSDNLLTESIENYLYTKEYKYEENNKIRFEDTVSYICSILTANRKEISYDKEEKLVKYLLDINPNDVDIYTRALTRATPHNIKRIADFVWGKFNDKFVDYEKKITFSAEQAHFIAILISRIYDGWNYVLDNYLSIDPNLKNNDDILGEVMRIAQDSRTTKDGRQRVLDYIHNTLGVSDEELLERGQKNVYIATSYEGLHDDIDKKRIYNVLSLLYSNLNNNLDYLNKALTDEYEKFKNDIHYNVRDILSWLSIMTKKISSYKQFNKIVTILKDENILDLLKGLKDANNRIKDEKINNFAFFLDKNMWIIAHNIRRANPIGYMNQFKRCITLLGELASDYPYIANKDSFIKFLLIKRQYDEKNADNGVLPELNTFEEIYTIIEFAKKLDIVTREDNEVYVAWAYNLFKKVNNEQDFDKAMEMLNNLTKNYPDISLEGKRKLYNNLLANAPWNKATLMMQPGQFIYSNFDVSTISSMLKVGNNELTKLLRGANVNNHDNINNIIAIINSINEYIELSQGKNMLLDGSSKTSLSFINKNITKPSIHNILLMHDEGEKVLKVFYSHIENNNVKENDRAKLVDIEDAQNWQILSNEEIIVKLNEIRAYFFNNEINETGRTFIVDKINNLLSNINSKVSKKKTELHQLLKEDIEPLSQEQKERLLELGKDPEVNLINELNTQETTKFKRETGVDTANIKTDELSSMQKEIKGLLETLLIKGNKDGFTLDDYFPVDCYYYEQVSIIIINFFTSDTEYRCRFIRKALRHLYENKKAINNPQKENVNNYKNFAEVLLSDLGFDDAVTMVEYIKDLSRLEIYKDVYTTRSLVMLGNKLKTDLTSRDVEIVKARIQKINDIISDVKYFQEEGSVLFFNVKDSRKMASFNYNLRHRNNNSGEVFFRELNKEQNQDININLPIASEQIEIRHAAWDMYEQQDSKHDIEPESLDLFMMREIQYLCKKISEGKITSFKGWFDYYHNGLDLLYDKDYQNGKEARIECVFEKVQANYVTYVNRYSISDDKWSILNHGIWDSKKRELNKIPRVLLKYFLCREIHHIRKNITNDVKANEELFEYFKKGMELLFSQNYLDATKDEEFFVKDDKKLIKKHMTPEEIYKSVCTEDEKYRQIYDFGISILLENKKPWIEQL